MPNYTLQGKLLQPITPEEFEAAIAYEKKRPYMQAYFVLLYYTGVRVSEALRAAKEAFNFDRVNLYWEVGKRLKRGRKTQPLPLALNQPHMDILYKRVIYTRKGQRVFPFDRTTAWRHCRKAGLGYNHHARLSAITFYLKMGYSIAHIVNWFGISVQTVNEYIGLLDLQEMGAKPRT